MKESDIRNPEFLKEYARLSAVDSERLFDISKYVHVNCPACGSGKYVKEFDKNGFTYVSCKNCGTLYTNPRPTQRQLDEFYSRSKSASYFAKNFIGPYAEKRREIVFRPRVVDVVKRFSELSGAKVGDIGAGNGIFLEELIKEWPDAKLVAIEPSVEAGKICAEKGLYVLPKMLEDVDPINEGGYNILFSFELFEHLFDPERFLEKVHSLLEQGGFLYLTTLNGYGFDIQVLWDRHDNVCPPHHLNFCNPNAMRILFERCGFEIVSIETPGKLDWDIIETRMNREGFPADRIWHRIAELDDEAKTGLQEWISGSDMSSHIRVIARKQCTRG